MKDHFVPEHLSLPLADMKGGESAGGHWRDEPVYSLPGYALFGLGIASPTVGIACEIVDHYNAVVKKKTSVMSEKNVADFSTQHVKFAEAKCATDAAHDLMRLTADRFQAIACDERRVPTPEERARCRGTATYAAQTAVAAAQTVWTLAGATSVLNTNPLSGVYADLMVACQHFTINKDANFKTYGRALYGLEIDNPNY
jgi:alkylation response protein AidB-like acyl-CoA dehydrogenase